MSILEENNNKQAQGYFWIIIVAILVFSIGGYIYISQGRSEKQTTNTPTRSFQVTDTEVSLVDESTEQDLSSVITVEGGSTYFKPNVIRVKQGQLVKIEFKNVEGNHNFVLDEFDIETKEIGPNQITEGIEFIADKVGEFEFYCSVSNHRQLGMVGKLIVEE
ncbi:MAG: cupredoxin domain-containing protein [bacterium]|nr:MAG: cupredoxin domain-containing protein [bacterium]